MPCPVRQPDIIRRARVARAAAVRARDIHIRQKLHIQTHHARSIAAGTTQRARVVGKIAGLAAARLCIRRSSIELAQLIMHAGIGGHGGADVDADGRRIDELDVRDALGADRPNVRRQRMAADAGLQRGDQALEHHGRLAGA